MGIVSEIIGIVTEWITGLISMLVSSASGLIAIFWTSGPDGTNGEFTVLGVFLLLALGMTIVMFVFNFIRGLIQR